MAVGVKKIDLRQSWRRSRKSTLSLQKKSKTMMKLIIIGGEEEESRELIFHRRGRL